MMNREHNKIKRFRYFKIVKQNSIVKENQTAVSANNNSSVISNLIVVTHMHAHLVRTEHKYRT